eukprot:NODE_1323_length_907_cov_202.432051_g1277_i0.p1 GENE.NODE_1323_length_907_cov_202.432051_g1277_i0~~NODE_1323_length_907_cov_202.432051_g1277_i0.p1  ORF type:complete len:248 (+),score=10.24 NODE_1323_length_907_cov_202.432051_g1277_i0:94-837(+)
MSAAALLKARQKNPLWWHIFFGLVYVISLLVSLVTSLRAWGQASLSYQDICTVCVCMLWAFVTTKLRKEPSVISDRFTQAFLFNGICQVCLARAMTVAVQLWVYNDASYGRVEPAVPWIIVGVPLIIGFFAFRQDYWKYLSSIQATALVISIIFGVFAATSPLAILLYGDPVFVFEHRYLGIWVSKYFECASLIGSAIYSVSKRRLSSLPPHLRRVTAAQVALAVSVCALAMPICVTYVFFGLGTLL